MRPPRIVALIVLAAACSKPPAPTPPLSDKDRKTVADAIAAMRSGDLDKALSLVGPLCDHRASSQLLEIKGIALLRKGNASEAVTALERAQALAPDDPEVALARAKAYLAAGKTDKAKDAAKLAEATLLEPTQLTTAIGSGTETKKIAMALRGAGQTYLRQSQSETALGYFQEAAAMDGDELISHLLLGGAWYNMKSYVKAADEFASATRKDDKNLTAWKLLGHCEKALGHEDQAKAAYAKVLELKPDDADALTALGRPVPPKPAPAPGAPMPAPAPAANPAPPAPAPKR